MDLPGGQKGVGKTVSVSLTSYSSFSSASSSSSAAAPRSTSPSSSSRFSSSPSSFSFSSTSLSLPSSSTSSSVVSGLSAMAQQAGGRPNHPADAVGRSDGLRPRQGAAAAAAAGGGGGGGVITASESGNAGVAASSSSAITAVQQSQPLQQQQQPAVTALLDRPDFNTVDFINQMFPNESSLVAVEPLIHRLWHKIRRVDTEILAAVRQQSSSGTKAREDLAAATNAIQELFLKIREIKVKAEQSEVMVQEICRDIKKLDFAKKHITTTITALHRLAMLVSAVDQLQVMASKRQYKDAAGQLEAVNQLCSHFESYKEIPKINELREKFANIKQMIKSHIFSDFSSFGVQGIRENGQLQQQLAEACLVVDALEPDVKEELISGFCSKELTAYQQIFQGTLEVAKLEKAERRYAWIKKQLRANEEVWQVFPASWRVPFLLCQQFCKVTRAQLMEIMDGMKDRPADVATLLQALQSTLDFERELEERFASGGGGGDGREGSRGSGFAGGGGAGAAAGGGGGEGDDGGPVVGGDNDDVDGVDGRVRMVKKKYEKKRKEGSGQSAESAAFRAGDSASSSSAGAASASGVATGSNGKPQQGEGGGALAPSSSSSSSYSPSGGGAITPSRFTFRGVISSCFEAHLSVYVDLEEKTLMETLEKLVQEETWGVEDGTQTNILSSSTQIFLHIKRSLKRCSALTKNQTLFNLFKVFQRVLRAYAGKLTARFPKATVPSGIIAAAAGTDWQQVRVSEKDEKVICYIINTAEYCHETTGKLAESIAKVIDPQFAERIDMQEEEEEFTGVITRALSILVIGMETRLDAELQNMTKVPWANLEAVGDQSEYVNGINAIFSSSSPVIAGLLSGINYLFFMDKLAASFAPKFYAGIFKCKRISETGAQQMLLDTQAVKTALLELPSLGGQSTVPSNYAKYVSREMGKAEALLKVILSPSETIADTFRALLPDGSAQDFIRMLDLKGFKKNEQQPLLEQFSRRGYGGASCTGGSYTHLDVYKRQPMMRPPPPS
ncbi:hypothetical protein CBR_g35042 [Chara braunii]|uniref:Uncharacterized protein n=1 Tax=Chara braunii TaxID=69332 RepID=A0A388LK69_CHABU|nr:hypothetical protein CBR_g35042 [Chara braunii]|eukprot:GBG82677.1 hypothetical protein CBR_g35042 [Chara braunii]